MAGAGTAPPANGGKVKYRTTTIYIPTDLAPLVDEVISFADKFKGVSVSSIILTALVACWPTMKKEIPTKRTFKLNGREVGV